MDQAEVALLDQVEQRQAAGLVLLRDRDHEAEVRVHELTLGVLAVAQLAAEAALVGRGQLRTGRESVSSFLAAVDALGETDLVVLGQQVVPADVLQVQTDQVLVLATVETVVSHNIPSAHGFTVPCEPRSAPGSAGSPAHS